MPKITFKFPDGSLKTVDAEIGTSVMEVAHKNDIPLEGACEGALACSTCHVILADEAVFDALPEPEEEEEDMLDLAFGLTLTSRLGCQIMVNEGLDGVVFELPAETRNISS